MSSKAILLIKKNNNFCFDSKNIIKLDLLSRIDNNIKQIKQDEVKITKKQKKNDFFTPKNKDDLFWCWFIFQNSLDDFFVINKKHFVIEKKQKIEWVQLLRENKKSIKELKYKISDLENNLVNEQKLNITTLETICYLNSIDFYLIKQKIYYKNVNDNENKLILKYFPESNKYGIFLNNDTQFLENIEKNLFMITNLKKPLKSISSYKAKELQDIASKLNISLTFESSKKTKTKKVLYSDIQEQLV